MAYIGTNPSNQNELLRTSAIPRDAERFSGNGSTTNFTLSRSLYGPTDADVVVENVYQEPIVSYNIVGNQLVFTEAPPSGTNNIYVVYRAVQGAQVTLPDGSVSYNKLANNIRLFTTDNYIGNTAISTYALSEAPADANTLAVSIDGIVQRAPINYTVSGQTITFTSAPPTGSNVHIKHLGFRSSATITAVPANTTIVQPVLSNPTITLAAENSSFKGNVALFDAAGTSQVGRFGATSTGQVQLDVGANTLSVRSSTIALANVTAFSTANTTGALGLSIDAAGRNLKPNQPAFYMANNFTSGYVSTDPSIPFAFNISRFNVGGHYNTSSSRFTAPVAGVYYFYYTFFFEGGLGNTGGNTDTCFYVNGSRLLGATVTSTEVIASRHGTDRTNTSQFTLVYLNVNDYVEVRGRQGNSGNCIFGPHSGFCGYLIG
jgi:hypothetical protein